MGRAVRVLCTLLAMIILLPLQLWYQTLSLPLAWLLLLINTWYNFSLHASSGSEGFFCRVEKNVSSLLWTSFQYTPTSEVTMKSIDSIWSGIVLRSWECLRVSNNVLINCFFSPKLYLREGMKISYLLVKILLGSYSFITQIRGSVNLLQIFQLLILELPGWRC